MTEDQKVEAIKQMLTSCELAMPEYRLLSARGTLIELGYHGEDLEEVIRFIADGGFDYCLDPHIRMTGHHEAQGEFPVPDVCYWGPDQLASRLQCLRNVPYHLLRDICL